MKQNMQHSNTKKTYCLDFSPFDLNGTRYVPVPASEYTSWCLNTYVYMYIVYHLYIYTPPKNIYTRKTNMTMEKQPFEDVSPAKNCDFPLLSFLF